MFDKKIIVENSLENAQIGELEGFKVLARLPYYRGLGLSMIEDISVSVDGEPAPRESVRFSARGNTWTLDEMENEHGDRWNFGEKAEVFVAKAGGLSSGEHQIQVSIRYRVSYLPFVPTTGDTKTLSI